MGKIGWFQGGATSGRIVRAMGVFSGVRIINILCSLVRNKLIAIFIGPAGMGLIALFNYIVDLVSQGTRLSIDQSAQRDISQASNEATPAILTVVRKWTLWMGLAAIVVMCALSPLLSIWTFHDTSHWPVFCLLAIVPFCMTYNTSVQAQNQGLKRYSQLASSVILGSVAGLLVAVPLIVWVGIDSIAWIIVAYGLCSLMGAYLFRPRQKSVSLPSRQIVDKGKEFVRLGARITAAWMISQGASYLFVLYLNAYASTEVLGIYQAGFTLMNSYVGIIFTALFVEYYPRVSASAHSPARLSLSASHECRLTLLVLTPLLCMMVVLINPIVRLIYSADFLAVAPFIALACIGVVFRVSSWCLAYVILARGDGKGYMISESLSSVIGLAANIVGYRLGGYIGLGIAYTAWFFIYTMIVVVMCRRRYGVHYTPLTVRYIVAAAAIVTATALLYLHFTM